MVYDLRLDVERNCYDLVQSEAVHSEFGPSLELITTTEAGQVGAFIEHLQQKLDEKLENGYAPDAPTLNDFTGE